MSMMQFDHSFSGKTSDGDQSKDSHEGEQSSEKG